MSKKLFDFCIGNPPYQETKGGTVNIDVWPDFVPAAASVSGSLSLIHPARWVIPKKNMIPVRDKLVSLGLKNINHYPDASKLFPKTAIDGGVSMTYIEENYSGDIKYFNEGKFFSVYETDGLFVTNRFEKEVVDKLLFQFHECPKIKTRVMGIPVAIGGSEFGYQKSKQIQFLRGSSIGMKDPVKIWANPGFGKGTRFQWMYIERDDLKNIPDGLFDSRKVMLDKKGNALSCRPANIINNLPVIVDKEVTASGDVFFIFPEHDTDYELELIRSMFMTKTIRFLMTLTQKDLYVRGFENVPDYTLFIPMLNGGLFTDEFFYTTYDFSQELIDYIEFHISEKKEKDR